MKIFHSVEALLRPFLKLNIFKIYLLSYVRFRILSSQISMD